MFHTTLIVRPDEVRDRVWILMDALIYETNAGQLIIVPRGFDTDFASIPRAVWAVYDPMGVYKLAAVIHDFLYYEHKIGDEPLSRAQADAIFLEAMESTKVGWLTRKIIYSAVRSFGWAYWNKRDKEIKNETV